MFKLNSPWLALISGAILLSAGTAVAQSDKALIDALIQKGILSKDEAAAIVKDVAKNESATEISTSGSKFLKKVTISGRLQAQFADLSAEIDGSTTPIAATQQFFMRRVYFGVKADFTGGWSTFVNYDFANASFDAAMITWKQSDLLAVDLGLRKAPIGLEEWDTSSGSLKAIERSPATRYWVESNNGRRLGAGSYRTGIFIGGSVNGFFYNAAVTNPERDEFSSLNGNSDPGVQGGGNATNNAFAWWGNGGYKGKFTGGTYRAGVSYGYLPDQGGTTLGKGHDLQVGSAYGVVTAGNFDLEGEYFFGKDRKGVADKTDANPTGYWIQPSFKITPEIEAVARYSYVDSDGRGVNISDGTRSAPSGGTMDKMSEWYVGGNYYFLGNNDVKFQFGYIHAESKDSVAGVAGPKAKADGVRSQMQVNF